MKAKILIAMDASDRAFRCIEHVTGLLGKEDKIQVTLLCILESSPSAGTRLEAFGVDSRQRLSRLGKVRDEVSNMEAVFDRATELLTEAGVAPEHISTKFKLKEGGVAQDIMTELEEGGYDMVVIGRRGLSKLKGFFLGSVSEGLVCRVKCAMIWVVP